MDLPTLGTETLQLPASLEPQPAQPQEWGTEGTNVLVTAPSSAFAVILHACAYRDFLEHIPCKLIHHLAQIPLSKLRIFFYQPFNSIVRSCLSLSQTRALLILTNDVGDHYAWNIVSNYSQNQAA